MWVHSGLHGGDVIGPENVVSKSGPLRDVTVTGLDK